MVDARKPTPPPMAAATQPSTGNRTGSWRFEKPVFEDGLAPCRRVCPLAEDIPTIMALHESGKFAEALGRILLENPFPGICGVICHHPCERACNRGRFDQPVSIRDLEFFASRAAAHGTSAPRPVPGEERQAAVVGTDLSAWSCAYFLKILGYGVRLIEGADRLRILDLAQPGFKLTREVLQLEIDRMLQLGIRVSLEVAFDEGLISELSAACGIVYLSAAAPEAWVRLWEAAGRADPDGHVAVDTGGRSPQTLTVWRAKGAGAAVVGVSAAESHGPSEASGKSAVRGIRRGKLAAAALDAFRLDLSTDCIRRSALAGSGSISMEAYRRGRSAGGFGLPARTVRFADINPAYHTHSHRIDPSSPDGLFSPKQAVRSAKRCFKCGICTFCNACRDFCPDVSIALNPSQGLRRIDYDHCKGCGICAQECPRGAIAWVKE